jgi:hypothetical protein
VARRFRRSDQAGSSTPRPDRGIRAFNAVALDHRSHRIVADAATLTDDFRSCDNDRSDAARNISPCNGAHLEQAGDLIFQWNFGLNDFDRRPTLNVRGQVQISIDPTTVIDLTSATSDSVHNRAAFGR